MRLRERFSGVKMSPLDSGSRQVSVADDRAPKALLSIFGWLL